MIRLIRVSHYVGGEFGGYTDLPDSCSRSMVVRNYMNRGYHKIHIPFLDGKIRMMNVHGYLCIIADDADMLVDVVS